MEYGIDTLILDVRFNDFAMLTDTRRVICNITKYICMSNMLLKTDMLSVYQECLTAPNTAIVSVSADDFQLF